jgi:hydrogenase nickel incorporation protein HypA/HybF
MHEMSIAMPLVGQLEQLAAEHQVERVESLTVSAGVLRMIVPEMLVAAFEAAAEGTCAEGAELIVELVPVKARCRACDSEFATDIDCYECPACNQADVDVVEGNDIVLSSVTFRQTDE